VAKKKGKRKDKREKKRERKRPTKALLTKKKSPTKAVK
jgi:hypothetical protein